MIVYNILQYSIAIQDDFAHELICRRDRGGVLGPNMKKSWRPTVIQLSISLVE
jgi:hypothetical protein